MELGELESIKGAGFNFVRWGMGWEAVEKSPGIFDWTAADAIFENLRRVGLPSIVIIGGGNHLYSPWLELPRLPGVRETRVPAPPESDAARMAWQRFAAAAAKRYADDPVTWEIWNEPDLSIFWPPQPDPDADAQLVSTTCGAIKRVVPGATVVAPSTAALPVRVPKFYTALADADVSGCLDGLSMHSYRIENGRQPDPESVERENLASRALLGRISDRWRTLPILCTEWGYPTSAVGPETQSAYLARTYLAKSRKRCRNNCLVRMEGLKERGSQSGVPFRSRDGTRCLQDNAKLRTHQAAASHEVCPPPRSRRPRRASSPL